MSLFLGKNMENMKLKNKIYYSNGNNMYAQNPYISYSITRLVPMWATITFILGIWNAFSLVSLDISYPCPMVPTIYYQQLT